MGQHDYHTAGHGVIRSRAGGVNPIDQNVLHTEIASLQSLVIPEPASAALLALLAAASLCGRRRRGTSS